MVQLELWHKIVLYILLLGSLFIYVRLSNIKINNIPLIRLEYRILIAVLFPLILIGAFIIGSVLLAIALAAISLIVLYSLFTKKRFKIKIKTKIPKRPLD